MERLSRDWRKQWLWKVSPENGYMTVGRQVDMPPQLHPQAEDTARERPKRGARGYRRRARGPGARQLSGYYCYFLFPPKRGN